MSEVTTNSFPQSLFGILKRLNVAADAWDYLLIGDGSGTQWKLPCGWASMMVENRTFARRAYHGSYSRGTNIIAEMMAYVHPLLELSTVKERQIGLDGSCRVHIITDCEYVKNGGNKEIILKKHRALWSVFDTLERQGFKIQFHWVERDLISANIFSHHLANKARTTAAAIDVKDLMEQKLYVSSLYDVNAV